MKVSAYYPIHYGKEYLEASIKSIRDHVDEILILYTDHPSYGKGTNLPNPDSKEEIRAIVENNANAFTWVNIKVSHQENLHRDQWRKYLGNADLVLAVDADEIWDDLDIAIKDAYDSKVKNVNVAGSQWKHFWRSFNECHQDGFAPTRFHNKRYTQDSGVIQSGKVYHMGYAQSEAITEYKISCHGHKSIPTRWFNDKWLTYRKGNTTHLHPDSQTVWIETNDFERNEMPQVLKDHPYFNVAKIV
jgi:hypothetical protein